MPTYDYEGRNPEGKLLIGKRIAQSPSMLSMQLLKENIFPIKINLVKLDTNFFARFSNFLTGGRVSVDELALFARQMHTLSKTGMPLTSSLRQLAENTRTVQMSNALYGVVESLESGRELAISMQDYPKIFSPIMISMVRIGQDSGRIDEAFLRLNQYLELEASGLKRLKTTFRYPAIVLLTITSAFVIVNIFVIPTFAKLFEHAHIPLPAITQVLIGISNLFVQQWPLLLASVSLAAVFFRRYLKSPTGQYKWCRLQIKIPVLGSIIRRVILLRFTQSFAITIDSGIPLLNGLSLVGQVINNAFAQREIMEMCESIRHGNNLTQSAANSNLFTKLEVQMLGVSEQTGELSHMLEEIALYYRREVDYDIKRLNDLMEPILIVIIAFMVLILALAVYLPIWNMVSLVQAH